jgi:AcrR family transcriptional regulator
LEIGRLNMKEEEAKPRKRLPASERKELILDAALRTFVEYGYHGAIMDTIAERANVTKPILYRHFPSKMDLLQAILERSGDELRSSMIEPNSPFVDLQERIRHDVKTHFDFVERREMVYRLLIESDLYVSEEISDRIAAIRTGIKDIVAESIYNNVDPTQVSRDRAEVIAVMIVGMVESTAIHWINSGDMPREIYEDNLVRGIFGILAGLPPSDSRRERLQGR